MGSIAKSRSEPTSMEWHWGILNNAHVGSTQP